MLDSRHGLPSPPQCPKHVAIFGRLLLFSALLEKMAPCLPSRISRFYFTIACLVLLPHWCVPQNATVVFRVDPRLSNITWTSEDEPSPQRFSSVSAFPSSFPLSGLVTVETLGCAPVRSSFNVTEVRFYRLAGSIIMLVEPLAGTPCLHPREGNINTNDAPCGIFSVRLSE